MKVLFTGGGTAGHVTPNIALIEALLDEGHECIYVGGKNAIEATIIAELPIRFLSISSGKLRRYFSWQNFFDLFRIFFGVLQSLLICVRERPDVIFSKGGFVSVPVVFAGWLCRIPSIAHESDVTPGLANRICIRFVKTICLNFSETLDFVPRHKAVVTGTPLRKTLLEGESQRGRDFLKVDTDQPILLVFGGSLGADVINRQLRRILPDILDTFFVVHVCGAGNIDESLSSTASYRQFEYLSAEFGDVLACADIVVSRAGANSLYELFVLRKPHLLIPLSAAVSRGDQLINASVFERAGYSRVLQESELSDENLKVQLVELFQQRHEIIKCLTGFDPKNSVSMLVEMIKKSGDIQ